jgi:exopolyphosphatase/guanosine-5'-triphosphate,3'-diphosphate pyrophosphatase
MNPERRAVIDIGTNSIKLLVGEVSAGVVQPVEERSEQTRLGAGFYENHELQPIPLARTASAVAKFVALARDLEARSVRVIATSAARDARNADELLSSIRRASGLRVEIISGEQEAEWVFEGVTTDPRLHDRPLFILDVGGGSTELIIGDHNHLRHRESFPVGSVRLLEVLRPHDPPSVSDLAATRDWLGKFFQITVGPKMDGSLPAEGALTLVGTGGTATILARMQLQTDQFDRERLESTVLSRDAVLDFMFKLWTVSLDDRRKIPGLPGNRADVILMGVAIYEVVMHHFKFLNLHVSTRGLRHGALLHQQ